jgi:hypothetical protein
LPAIELKNGIYQLSKGNVILKKYQKKKYKRRIHLKKNLNEKGG